MLCPEVSISDVINKVGMCGISIQYVTSQPLSALYRQSVSHHGGAMAGSNRKQLFTSF